LLPIKTIENITLYVIKTDRSNEPTTYLCTEVIQEIRTYDEFKEGQLYAAITSGTNYQVSSSIECTAVAEKENEKGYK